jgi:undecaprenyl pyrophosphate synthase
MAHISNQQDIYNVSQALGQRGTNISAAMMALARKASDANITQGQLMEIQIQIQDLQRQAEMVKEIQGQIKKNQETANKAPQS